MLFRSDTPSTDPLAEYLADIYTLGVNLAGLPAMSIPIGFGQGKNAHRPVGLQLIGPKFQESLLLKAAHHFQAATDWHCQHPNPAGGQS